MKLGILDAVPPEYAHVDENISDAEKFIDFLNAAQVQAEMQVYNVGAEQFPDDVHDCDAYLITGSPCSVYEDEVWIHRLKGFARQAYHLQKPLVGICFGHQLIADALGGKVVESPDGWLLGLLEFDLLDTPAWMGENGDRCKIYHINKDQVVYLPKHAQRIGQSDACPNSMYVIGNQVLCIQGHPEQPLRAMNNFIEDLGDTLPPDLVARARQSFEDGKPDDRRVGNWIRRFLEQKRD